MKIVCVMLINGLEIIGETDSEMTDDVINLEYPVELKEIVNTDGTVSIAALPFMTYSKDKLFTIKQKHIITSCELAQDVREYYQQIKTFYKQEAKTLSDEEKEAIYKWFGNTGGNSIN